MKKNRFTVMIYFSIATLFLFSCGKGYSVRFTNYNTEAMDSVIIGKELIIFTKVDKQTTTDYNKVSAGSQIIKCVTKTKKVYTSTISIPKKGTGKRTIQIDGLNTISILED